jgi:hypothetical protein
MTVPYGGNRFQRRLIYPGVWMVLSATMHSGFMFRSTVVLRIMRTDSKRVLFLSEPNLCDSIPDSPMDSACPSKEEEKRYLSGDQMKKRVKNYPTLLRKVMAEMCRDMSPQEAFEFRLQSRLDYRFVPYGTNPPTALGEQGLVYSIANPDFLALDGAELRTLIEDDDRYRVAWGDLDLPKTNGTAMVLFMPQDLKERQEKDVDALALENPHRLNPGPFRPLFLILASIPELASYLAQFSLGFLLISAVFLTPHNEIIETAMAALTIPPESDWFYGIYFTIAFPTYCVLWSIGMQLIWAALSKYSDVIDKLWKDIMKE